MCAEAPPVKSLTLLPGQRAFAVGDIHGAYGLLDEALGLLAFDPACDRLLCVGDFVDRGPDSERVVEFLQRPYVHAVRGNHEDILIRAHAGGVVNASLLALMQRAYEADWWFRLGTSRQQQVLAQVRQLPLALDVQTPTGRVGLVHADLPLDMSWPQIMQGLQQARADIRGLVLESRRRLRQAIDAPVEGVERVYVGHSVLERPLVLGNIAHVDTGAVFGLLTPASGGHLTLVDVQAPLQCLSGRPSLETPRVKIYGLS